MFSKLFFSVFELTFYQNSFFQFFLDLLNEFTEFIIFALSSCSIKLFSNKKILFLIFNHQKTFQNLFADIVQSYANLTVPSAMLFILQSSFYVLCSMFYVAHSMFFILCFSFYVFYSLLFIICFSFCLSFHVFYSMFFILMLIIITIIIIICYLKKVKKLKLKKGTPSKRFPAR